MRLPVALGLFLGIIGLMILILKPVYEVPAADRPLTIEAVTPLYDVRPIPEWVGIAALISGGVLLLGEVLRRR